MKVVNIPIDMISKTTKEGVVTPVKFRMIDTDESWLEVKVDQVITREFDRSAGNKMWVYNCQSSIHGILKPYQLKMEIDTCKWVLFKI